MNQALETHTQHSQVQDTKRAKEIGTKWYTLLQNGQLYKENCKLDFLYDRQR